MKPDYESVGGKLSLERLNVRRLPALRALYHVELNRLTFLEALEAAAVDRRVVNEDVLAILTADEAKTLGIVKPLYCSLFHVFLFLNYFCLDPDRSFV